MLTPAQFVVLDHVFYNPWQTVREIADATGRSKSYTAKVLKQLMDKYHVSRSAEDSEYGERGLPTNFYYVPGAEAHEVKIELALYERATPPQTVVLVNSPDVQRNVVPAHDVLRGAHFLATVAHAYVSGAPGASRGSAKKALAYRIPPSKAGYARRKDVICYRIPAPDALLDWASLPF